MARTPEYFQRLIDVLPEFERMPAGQWIDRETFQQVLGVSKPTTCRIIKALGWTGRRMGGAWVCEPDIVVKGIRHLRDTGEILYEEARRERVESNLQQLADVARARGVEIARGAKALEILSTVPGRLPDGLEFQHCRLVVDFANPLDLLEKLFAFVSACKNEPEGMLDYIEKQSK